MDYSSSVLMKSLVSKFRVVWQEDIDSRCNSRQSGKDIDKQLTPKEINVDIVEKILTALKLTKEKYSP